jgi:hypothetical protein
MDVQVNIGTQGTSFKLALQVLLQQSYFEEVKVTNYEVGTSDGGDWGPEQILIASLFSNSKKSIVDTLEAVCHDLNEEAITVKLEGKSDGFIVFNPSYEGERYEFNEAYFVSI